MPSVGLALEALEQSLEVLGGQLDVGVELADVGVVVEVDGCRGPS